MADASRTHGTIKRFFRTRNYGFVEISDAETKSKYPVDIFFHLDHISNEIPIQNIVKGQPITFVLKQVKQGWAADDIQLAPA